jgi:hypothetical protein
MRTVWGTMKLGLFAERYMANDMNYTVSWSFSKVCLPVQDICCDIHVGRQRSYGGEILSASTIRRMKYLHRNPESNKRRRKGNRMPFPGGNKYGT